MQNGTLVKTIFLKASPEKVWAFLTESEKLAQWFHATRADLAVGADYALIGDDGKDLCWGKVLAATPHTKLVYSFTHNHMAGHETTVTWELEAVLGGTQLLVTHEGLDTSAAPLEMLCGHDKGWDDHFAKLREKVA